MGGIVLVLRFKWDDTICFYMYRGMAFVKVKCLYGPWCRTNIKYTSFEK
jgi:hypothetical protein